MATLVLLGLLSLFYNKAKVVDKPIVAQNVVYNAILSSAGKDVVGYDAILQFDPKTTHIGVVRSHIKDFDVVQNIAGDGVLTLTVIKLPTSKEGTVFDKTLALEIPVTYSSADATRVKVISMYQKNTTKMVDSKLNVLRLETPGVSIVLEPK
jgi:hypothetical protein